MNNTEFKTDSTIQIKKMYVTTMKHLPDIILHIRGFMIAGQKQRRKRKALRRNKNREGFLPCNHVKKNASSAVDFKKIDWTTMTFFPRRLRRGFKTRRSYIKSTAH